MRRPICRSAARARRRALRSAPSADAPPARKRRPRATTPRGARSAMALLGPFQLGARSRLLVLRVLRGLAEDLVELRLELDEIDEVLDVIELRRIDAHDRAE